MEDGDEIDAMLHQTGGALLTWSFSVGSCEKYDALDSVITLVDIPMDLHYGNCNRHLNCRPCLENMACSSRVLSVMWTRMKIWNLKIMFWCTSLVHHNVALHQHRNCLLMLRMHMFFLVIDSRYTSEGRDMTRDHESRDTINF